jgi:hypothetical protein
MMRRRLKLRTYGDTPVFVAACLTLATVRLLGAAQPLPESEIRRLDCILRERSVDLVGGRVDECRVALGFGETERRTERSQQRVHDVGDDVLTVVEFDAGYEFCIAGNVGDHETG